MRSDTRACAQEFYQNRFRIFRFWGRNIEMFWDQIQEPAPTSFTKTDLKISDLEVKTLKCLEVKYKSLSPRVWPKRILSFPILRPKHQNVLRSNTRARSLDVPKAKCPKSVSLVPKNVLTTKTTVTTTRTTTTTTTTPPFPKRRRLHES